MSTSPLLRQSDSYFFLREVLSGLRAPVVARWSLGKCPQGFAPSLPVRRAARRKVKPPAERHVKGSVCHARPARDPDSLPSGPGGVDAGRPHLVPSALAVAAVSRADGNPQGDGGNVVHQRVGDRSAGAQSCRAPHGSRYCPIPDLVCVSARGWVYFGGLAYTTIPPAAHVGRDVGTTKVRRAKDS